MFLRLLCLCCLLSAACAEDLLGTGPVKDLAAARRVSEKALQAVLEGDAATGLGRLMTDHWYHDGMVEQDIAKVVKPFEANGQMSAVYGRMRSDKGITYLGGDSLKDINARLCFIIFSERMYIPFIFIWHQRDDRWVLTGMTYGNGAEPALEKFRERLKD